MALALLSYLWYRFGVKMKQVRHKARHTLLFSLLFAACAFTFQACSGSSTPSMPSSPPIAIEGLDGETGVETNATFSYTLGEGITPDLVTEQTFFIVQTPAQLTDIASFDKAMINPAICQLINALTAAIDCHLTVSCTLEPAVDLTCATGYTICVSIESAMYSFTTEACP